MNKKTLAYAALGVSTYMLISMSVSLYKNVSSLFNQRNYESRNFLINLKNSPSTNLETTVEAIE